MSSIEDAPDGMLRAWADSGVISSARYVDEMERRRGLRAVGEPMPVRTHIDPAPPLDYALEQDLAADLDIPRLDRIEAMFEDGAPVGPLPPAVRVILAVAAGIVVIAIFMVLPWRG